MPMSGLNESGSNGQAELEGSWIIQAVGSVGQVAGPIAYGGVFFRCGDGFQMLGQGLNDFSHGSALEPALLGSAPPLWSLRPAAVSRGGQILADMKEIAQEGSLRPENLAGLHPDPFGAVPLGVNLAV